MSRRVRARRARRARANDARILFFVLLFCVESSSVPLGHVRDGAISVAVDRIRARARATQANEPRVTRTCVGLIASEAHGCRSTTRERGDCGCAIAVVQTIVIRGRCACLCDAMRSDTGRGGCGCGCARAGRVFRGLTCGRDDAR